MSDYEILSIAEKFCSIPNPTVRNMTNYCNYSKTTIHNVLTSHKLLYLNENLFNKCKNILTTNYNERHIRGGESTKRKYSKKN